MRHRKYWLLSFVVLFAFLSSCELVDEGDSTEVAAQIEGRWSCIDEHVGLKSTMDSYYVYIYPHPNDDQKVMIENFHAIDQNIAAEATISGRTLVIQTQVIGNDFTIEGSGTINSAYDEINWSYRVDDGSGIWENYSAVYTFLD